MKRAAKAAKKAAAGSISEPVVKPKAKARS